MTLSRNGHEQHRHYAKHGLTSLKAAVKGLGGRVIDRRTTLGKALAEWKRSLIADLGGRDQISTQQEAIVDLAVKTKLLLDSIDTWLLVQPSLINARKRCLLPVVRERTQLADALARYLQALGLARRHAIGIPASPHAAAVAQLEAEAPPTDSGADVHVSATSAQGSDNAGGAVD